MKKLNAETIYKMYKKKYPEMEDKDIAKFTGTFTDGIKYSLESITGKTFGKRKTEKIIKIEEDWN